MTREDQLAWGPTCPVRTCTFAHFLGMCFTTPCSAASVLAATASAGMLLRATRMLTHVPEGGTMYVASSACFS